MDALRQKRQLEATALGKTVERGTQTEFNPVNQITVPTNVNCSPGGECYDTSRKCEGLKNVSMDAIRRRRSCMYCVQRKGQQSGEHRENALENDKKSLHLARSSVLHESMRRSVVVAQAATMRSGRLSIAIAGRNDEVGRTDESTKHVRMTWVEDATKYEDKQCLQRDVTEVYVSRRGAGRTCLMFIVTRVV